jgi:pimeloyl-ACP methyl ester carboxylesterase
VAALQSEGAPPLVVFLHGIQGTKELFSSLIQEPFLQHHATLAIDLPGFGDSSKSQSFDYSIAAFAHWLYELLGSYKQDVVLVGHSLGGMIATRLLESDLKIRGLVSLEGNLKLADCGSTRDIAAITEEEFTECYLPRLLDTLSRSSEPSAAFRLAALQKADPHALYLTSRAIVEESKSEVLFDLLSGTESAALLLVGARSSFATKSVPGKTQTVMIPDASHFLLHDNYPAVVSAIEKFFKTL